MAIVTGAGQGIGRGVALAVAAEGANVVVLGRTLAKCETVVAEIQERGGEAVAELCDVAHRDEVEESVERTIARWGRIDLLVNNAQTKVYQSVRKITDADMETMWQSGPMATLRFMQACFHTFGMLPAAWSTWDPSFLRSFRKDYDEPRVCDDQGSGRVLTAWRLWSGAGTASA